MHSIFVKQSTVHSQSLHTINFYSRLKPFTFKSASTLIKIQFCYVCALFYCRHFVRENTFSLALKYSKSILECISIVFCSTVCIQSYPGSVGPQECPKWVTWKYRMLLVIWFVHFVSFSVWRSGLQEEFFIPLLI